MLEAVIGGLVGAVVGAFAGGYATYRAERTLDRRRQSERTMEWMLSELTWLKSEMAHVMFVMASGEDVPDEVLQEVSDRASDMRGRIHELDGSDTRENLYRLFETHYDEYSDMYGAITEQWRRMHKRKRPELRDVRRELHGEAEDGSFLDFALANRSMKWTMPHHPAWRRKVRTRTFETKEMMKRRKRGNHYDHGGSGLPNENVEQGEEDNT